MGSFSLELGLQMFVSHHVLGKEPRSFCKTIIHSDISPGPNYRIFKKKKIRESVKSSKIAGRVMSWDFPWTTAETAGNLNTRHPQGGRINSSWITKPLEKHLLACVYRRRGKRRKASSEEQMPEWCVCNR